MLRTPGLPYDRRTSFVLMCVVIAIGACVRLLAINAQLDYTDSWGFSFHYDEHRFVAAAQQFETAPDDLRGYVVGMASQLFAVLGFTRLADLHLNPVLLLRLIGFLHALITIAVTYTLARIWIRDRRVAILAALLLALTPLHVANSNYGTADIAAVNLFYLTYLAGYRYVRKGTTGYLLAMCILCGACLATKFFLPLLMVPALVWMAECRRSRIEVLIFGLVCVAGGFWLFSLLNYGLWDFLNLIDVLLNGNLIQNEGRSPWQNLILYPWRLIPSLGIPVFALALLGLPLVLKAAWSRWQAASVDKTVLREIWMHRISSPEVLLAAPLVVHVILILVAGASSTRHLLPFTPVLCILAACGGLAIGRWTGIGRTTALVSVTGLVGYLVMLTVGLQQLFIDDLRKPLAAEAKAREAEGQRVYAGNYYTRVRGTFPEPFSPENLSVADVVLTCDLHYERYLRQADASKMHHPQGGQSHTDFFRDVFLGDSPYRIAAVLEQEPQTIEQRLTALGYLPPLETFTPGRCLVLATESSMDEAEQARVRDDAWRIVSEKRDRFIRYGGRY